ncbi:MAG: hypothetical protein J4G14_13690 [Dehalococcoidia bacterium]|nr:hypothetical protein [Dehalococcoidia bacterium]
MQSHITRGKTSLLSFCGDRDAVFVVTLAKYEHDYRRAKTGKYRPELCPVCEQVALKLLRLPHPRSLRCFYCPHPLSEHRTVPDGAMLFTGCLGCPRTKVLQPDGKVKQFGGVCLVLNPEGNELAEKIVSGQVLRFNGIKLASMGAPSAPR